MYKRHTMIYTQNDKLIVEIANYNTGDTIRKFTNITPSSRDRINDVIDNKSDLIITLWNTGINISVYH